MKEEKKKKRSHAARETGRKETKKVLGNAT